LPSIPYRIIRRGRERGCSLKVCRVDVGLSVDPEEDVNVPILVDHEPIAQSFVNVPVELGGGIP
jgi:hypothetical protein